MSSGSGPHGKRTAAECREDLYKRVLDNLSDAVYLVDRDRRITYWNKAAEKITGYASSEVIGRHCRDNLLVHIDEEGTNLCATACPLEQAMSSDREHEADVYLHHKDGHRVPVSVRVTPMHDEEDRVVGAAEIFNDSSPKLAVMRRMEELQEQAWVDPLTGLSSRRHTEIVLSAKIDENARYGWSFGVLFVDIDHFKRVNDSYGHDIGDRVLKMVAKTMSSCSRSFDMIGRWGGEEFLVTVTGVDERGLEQAAERLRVLVAQSGFSIRSHAVRVTVSVGATLVRPHDTAQTLVGRADKLMYESKSAGRNRVSVAA